MKIMDALDHICAEIQQHQTVLNDFIKSPSLYQVEAAADILVSCLSSGGKILACGNGGSFSDAQHFASELTGRYRQSRAPMAAIALSDGGAMSCIANDFGYGQVFSRQVSALGKPGDVLLCLSTSGNSDNVVNASYAAMDLGMKVITICGRGGRLRDTSDLVIEIPHGGYADRIQELSILLIHILVSIVEKRLK